MYLYFYNFIIITTFCSMSHLCIPESYPLYNLIHCGLFNCVRNWKIFFSEPILYCQFCQFLSRLATPKICKTLGNWQIFIFSCQIYFIFTCSKCCQWKLAISCYFFITYASINIILILPSFNLPLRIKGL